jgi:hypothetical protein
MLLKTIYERVTISGANIPPVEFVTAFNLFTDYLLSRYGEDYVIKPSSTYTEATSVDDDVAVLNSYSAAYVDHICGLALKDSAKQADAVAKADFAFRAEWRKKAKGKRIRKEVWM